MSSLNLRTVSIFLIIHVDELFSTCLTYFAILKHELGMRICQSRSWVPALEGPYCIQESVTTLWNTAHQGVRKVRDWNVWAFKFHIQDFASSAMTNSSTKAFGTGMCIVKNKAFNIMKSTHPFPTSFILSSWRELLAFVLLITFSH